MQNTRLSSNVFLAASAFVLAGLIVFASGVWTSPAKADLVASTSSLTALTAESQNQDVLFIVDNRSERLLTYKVVNQTSLELFATYDLARLFSEARARASGRLK